MTDSMRRESTPTTVPPIPYGWSDFALIRREGALYVDKTRFLRELEAERYAFLIRPRRFGKSCWVSMLENYYDRGRAEHFGQLFEGTDIGHRPTANRNRYVVLRFDFSAFDDTLETLRERFETYCHTRLRSALEKNDDLFPGDVRQRILDSGAIDGKLNELFAYAGDEGISLFVLIDEYDNFANTVLAHRGAEAYESFTHGGGFYRSFFATLKAGTAGGGIERLFITGVSPITMDDVTSGFNIGTNISLDGRFNEVLGFTETEVRGVLEDYREAGALDQDVDGILDLMGNWYNGYRFAGNGQVDLYNTNMVLYYIKACIPNREGPHELIDRNVRINYGNLRHLLTVSQRAGGMRLNGNFDLLRHVVGKGWVDSDIESGFPLDRLDQRENFVSLMHYFGLLSIREVRDGIPRLGIPNQTVKRLMYGYLRDAYEDVGVFAVDVYAFSRLMHEMAFRGAWRPVMEFLRDAMAAQTGIRDYIEGERLLQGFLAAYLNITDYFVFHTERELNKGYADICLEPLLARYPGIQNGYVIELKYLNRDAGDEAHVASAAHEAEAQLKQYLADERLARQYPSVDFTGLVVVFHGWEMVHCDTVSLESPLGDGKAEGETATANDPEGRS